MSSRSWLVYSTIIRTIYRRGALFLFCFLGGIQNPLVDELEIILHAFLWKYINLKTITL